MIKFHQVTAASANAVRAATPMAKMLGVEALKGGVVAISMVACSAVATAGVLRFTTWSAQRSAAKANAAAAAQATPFEFPPPKAEVLYDVAA